MKSFFRSFAGGEITPELFGRLDLPKFQTGLRQCLNYRTLPHGPADRRPGYYFVNEAKSSTTPGQSAVRLIPFVYSAGQAMMLELGHQYARFHNNTGTLVEPDKTVTGWTIASPGVFTSAAHGYTTGQWVYLRDATNNTPIAGRFLKVNVLNANTYNLVALDGTVISTLGFSAYVGPVFTARVYEIATTYAAADLFKLRYAQNADVLTLTHSMYPTREVRRLGTTNWTITDVSFAASLAAPGGTSATATVAVASNLTPQHYKVTAVAADLVTESLASVDNTCSNNLTLAGNYNTIAWAAVVGAARYYVYKQRGGTYGYIGQTSALNLVDDNILADTSISPPEDIIDLNSGAGDYPTSVTYYERRRWFGGTTQKQQNVWATRNGTESNLNSSVPSRDDDALEFRLAAQQQNAIQHLVPLVDVIALTRGGEFRIYADGGPAIVPSTLAIKPQGFSGASDAQPALTTGSALYVQAQGSRIRELGYDPAGTGFYRSIDVSLMAPHLFNGYSIHELAYTRAPESELWACRGDGTLLGMTYVPDQQVYGWHHHTTDGAFASVAVIPEDDEDVQYSAVQRTINGRAVTYIERLKSRLFTAQADAFFVDAGLTYSGSPTTTITNLWHLEGKAVQVLADGAVVTGRTVVNGVLTPALTTAASQVHVGLGYVSDLMTLPLAYESAPASGQGTMKNVSHVYMRVTGTSVVKAGPTFSKLTEYAPRLVSDPYGSPPSFQTAEFSMGISPSWNTDGSVCVRQDLPLPLTLVAMALETQTGG